MIDLQSQRKEFFENFTLLKELIEEDEKIKDVMEIFHDENPIANEIVSDINLDMCIVNKHKEYPYMLNQNSKEIGILFSHFSCLKNEFDSYDFPFLIKQAYPKYRVFASRIKEYNDCTYWELMSDKSFVRVKEEIVSKNTDLIISRSTSLKIIFDRMPHLQHVPSANVMPMGLKKILSGREALSSFGIRDFYRPASPVFLTNARNCLNKIKKENLIVLSGSLRPVKNQLYFIESLEPELVKNYSILFIGDCSSDYASYVKKIADNKKIKTYFLGKVHHRYVHYFYCISILHVLNTCVSKYSSEQIYDPGPRCLSEAIACNCHSVVSNEVLVRSVEKKYTDIYSFKENNFNDVLKSSLDFAKNNQSRIDYINTSPKFEATGMRLFNNVLSILSS